MNYHKVIAAYCYEWSRNNDAKDNEQVIFSSLSSFSYGIKVFSIIHVFEKPILYWDFSSLSI